MKILKKLVLSVAMVCLCCCGVALSGCNNEDLKVISIEKTNSAGNVDIYTITYSNNETYEFEVTNGKDGQGVTVDDLYNKYVEIYGDIDYKEFLKLYLASNEDGVATAINQALLSSAKVFTEFYETKLVASDSIFGGTQQVKTKSVYQGSAVIWQIDAENTYFVTNYHVIYSAHANGDNKGNTTPKAMIYLYGSEGFPVEDGTELLSGTNYKKYNYGDYAIPCTYFGGSVENDIAILKASTADVLAINPNVESITVAENYHVGQTAIAIGNSEGEGISVTRGVVSVDSEYINLEIDTVRAYRLLRIDTAIYSGNSGGGLFNQNGELIGITNSGDVTDQNINYAIPIEVVNSTVNNLLTYCNADNQSVKKIKLGITIVEENSKYVFDASTGYGAIEATLKLTDVAEGSIGETVGLQVDDFLTAVKVNNTTHVLKRSHYFDPILLDIREGDKLTFSFLRNGEELTSTEFTVKSENINVVVS